MDSFLEGAKVGFILAGFIIFIALCARFAVTFRLRVPRSRGKDLEVTHQVKGVEANNAQDAMHKAYKTLSEEQQSQVTGVYMKRDDEE